MQIIRTTFRSEYYSVDFYKDFLDSEQSAKLYELCLSLLKPFKIGNRRTNKTFGDEGLIYEIKFKNGTVRRPTEEWPEDIKKIKTRIEKLVDAKLNICVLQYYPNGNVGINPHRDKEMIHGTKICGLSLGETRTLSMAYRSLEHDIKLPEGSLYIFNPPTNDFWSHSISKDSSKNPRISLTFRNY